LCRRNSDWRELGRVLVDRSLVFEDIKSEDLTPPPLPRAFPRQVTWYRDGPGVGIAVR
jgi:hypothetical protein